MYRMLSVFPRIISRYFLHLSITLIAMGIVPQATATERVSINGQVTFDGTPVCAMVLANGQNVFSCSGDGSYQLSVPLDGNGQITLFSFASGFASFKQILTPIEAASFTIEMVREADGRNLTVSHTAAAKQGNRAFVHGTVSYKETPICALILANGQHMFSCGQSLGVFKLDVSLDRERNITLFAFASGSQPYKTVFNVPLDTTQHLNDTGIIGCSNNNSNDLGCPTENYPGQDAEYGRDVTHNDDSDGHAGFSFTKLDADGNPLPPSATNWSCVKDNVTGLIWEVKTDDGGLHDRDDSYNWYNTDSTSNGGDPGSANDDGAICYDYDSTDPASYCNTQAYVARVNQAGWCGQYDWRMPIREELRSLVDYSISYPGPTIGADYFPNDQAAVVWSSSPYANRSDYAWVLEFWDGGDTMLNKNSNFYVRLVRGGQ